MNLRQKGGLFLLLTLVLAGCRTEAYRKSILARAKALQTSPEYLIGEGDSITIDIVGEFGEEALRNYTMQATVRPDGKVSFPGYGEIDVLNKSTPQLRAELEQGFEKSLGLKAPTVHVAVNSFASKRFTVAGEIPRPGTINYTGQTRVLEALVNSGDWRRTAIRSAPNRTLLFREVDGETKIYNVKLNDFVTKGDFSTNYYLRPGDFVFVPRNNFAKIGDAITTFMLPISGFFSFINVGNSTASIFVP